MPTGAEKLITPRKPTLQELLELREIAEFQFGVKGEYLIPSDILVVESPTTSRIRLIISEGKPYLSIRARDYRFNLHIAAGYVLNRVLPKPKLRVYVKDEYASFVSMGKTLFCKHVLLADPGIRPDDEVLVLDGNGELVAVGRATKAGWEMVFHKRGEAVKIREGARSHHSAIYVPKPLTP